MSLTIADAAKQLEQLAPLELAEDWDNVGLLAGEPTAPLGRVMTCLTLSPDVVEEAVERRADLVVTHHPLPFRGVQRLTTESIDGGSLWRLLGSGVAVYSAHTAYDSAAGGINAQWADRLSLSGTEAMVPAEGRVDGAGVGRVGDRAANDFDALLGDVAGVAGDAVVRSIPPEPGSGKRVAIACGSGGSLLDLALAAGCEVFLTGELGFHECLRCRSLGVGVILTGHYASERFAMETLAERLAERLPGVEAWPSAVESDPLRVAS